MLKSLFTILFCSVLVFSCQKNDDLDMQNRNPYIPNAFFSIDIQTGLSAEYPNLATPSGHAIINGYNIGHNGIVLFNTGTGYLAWELSDPNHQISTCSTLTIEGVIATCSCDDNNSYFISNGLPLSDTSGQYTLIPYFVEVNGSVIRVYNN
ncbi:hypothetical protein [Olleya namhaensis]|uniref:hypothetical protein n=1 Tax=Olleya namhaensis TaxID=1144750 RepID=UPI00248FA1A6|nr:hypothetical protein [Olleya namhaensis]